MGRQNVLIIDLGGWRGQLLARRLREAGVFCEVCPHTISTQAIAEKKPLGIILTGGMGPVCCETSPTVDPGI